MQLYKLEIKPQVISFIFPTSFGCGAFIKKHFVSNQITYMHKYMYKIAVRLNACLKALCVCVRNGQTDRHIRMDGRTNQTARHTDRATSSQPTRQLARRKDRRTARQNYVQTEVQTNGQDGLTDGRKYIHTDRDRQTGRQAGRQTDRRTDKKTDRQMDTYIHSDRQVERQTDRQADIHVFIVTHSYNSELRNKKQKVGTKK